MIQQMSKLKHVLERCTPQWSYSCSQASDLLCSLGIVSLVFLAVSNFCETHHLDKRLKYSNVIHTAFYGKPVSIQRLAQLLGLTLEGLESTQCHRNINTSVLNSPRHISGLSNCHMWMHPLGRTSTILPSLELRLACFHSVILAGLLWPVYKQIWRGDNYNMCLLLQGNAKSLFHG